MQVEIKLLNQNMDKEVRQNKGDFESQLPELKLNYATMQEQLNQNGIVQLLILCGICYESKQADKLSYFCCQNHRFCKKCIIQVLAHCLSNYKLAKCPNEQCVAQLNQSSPYFEQLNPQTQKKILKIRGNIQILKNPLMKICKKDQCDGTLLMTPEKAECHLCKENHCAKCFQIQHKGYCDTEVVIKLNKRYRYKKCPNCLVVIEKLRGCNHIVCTCGFNFCYKCGDIFNNNHAGHKCAITQSCLQSYRMRFQDGQHSIASINFGSILHRIQSNAGSGLVKKYLYVCLVSLIYPLLMLLSIILYICQLLTLLILFLTLYCISAVILPIAEIFDMIAEIFNMKLILGKLIKMIGLPKLLNSLLLLLLLPISILLMFFFMPFRSDFRQGIEALLYFLKNIAHKTWPIVVFSTLLPFIMCMREEVEPYD